MQYELWCKPRELEFNEKTFTTDLSYKFITSFYDERLMNSVIDSVDKNRYEKAMILQTEIDKEPIEKMYIEYEKSKTLIKK